MNPDYVKWLKKPCWSKLEILYLVWGVDPSHAIDDEAITVDLESGESCPAPPDESAIKLAAKLGNQSIKSGLSDLLNRAIMAGDLHPTQAGVDCYRPDEVVRLLIQQQFNLPHELVSAFEEKPQAVEEETPKKRREKHDITAERGSRRSILENWDDIEKECGPNADGRQVLRILKKKLDAAEKKPKLKTVQNVLIDLRNEKLIP